MSPSIIYLGLDVHKESITIAVLPNDAATPTRLERLSYDLRKLHRCLTGERVREIVRWRETPQREILRSRHYLVKLLFRRGLIYRDGAHWTQRHRTWLAGLQRRGRHSPQLPR